MLSSLQSPSVIFQSFNFTEAFNGWSQRSFSVNVTLPLKVCGLFSNNLLILISNIIPQWKKNRLYMISIPSDHEIFFHLVLHPWMCSSVSCFIVYGNWIEFVSCYCVKVLQILIMLSWFIVLFRSTISFYFSVYSFY